MIEFVQLPLCVLVSLCCSFGVPFFCFVQISITHTPSLASSRQASRQASRLAQPLTHTELECVTRDTRTQSLSLSLSLSRSLALSLSQYSQLSALTLTAETKTIKRQKKHNLPQVG